MKKSSNAVLKQALELSPLERAQLVEEVLISLDTPDPQMDLLWAKEADSRIQAFDKGEIESTSAEKVFSKFSNR